MRTGTNLFTSVQGVQGRTFAVVFNAYRVTLCTGIQCLQGWTCSRAHKTYRRWNFLLSFNAYRGEPFHWRSKRIGANLFTGVQSVQGRNFFKETRNVQDAYIFTIVACVQAWTRLYEVIPQSSGACECCSCEGGFDWLIWLFGGTFSVIGSGKFLLLFTVDKVRFFFLSLN